MTKNALTILEVHAILILDMDPSTIQYRVLRAGAAEMATAEPFNLIRVIPA